MLDSTGYSNEVVNSGKIKNTILDILKTILDTLKTSENK